MVAPESVGVKISVGVELAGCVTNVFDNEAGVAAAVGGIVVTPAEKISVGIVSAMGKSITGFPPMGVGV